MPFDPRFLVGPAMLIIGALHLAVSYRLTVVHPVNRVFRLGPFLTPAGLVALLSLRLFLLAMGLFLVAWGAANIYFWWFASADPFDSTVQFLGALGTGFAVWSAGQALWLAYKLWVR